MKSSKAVPMGIRVPPEIAAWLKEQAEQNRRSVSGQAVWAISQYRAQQPPQPQGAQQ